MKENHRDGGYALVIIMGFVAVLSSLLAVAIALSTSQIRIATKQSDLERSLYVAQAGAERAAAYVASGGDGPWSASGQIGDGTYVVAIVPAALPSSAPRTLGGWIGINPSGSAAFEFVLRKPDGSMIDGDTLGEDFGGYTGPAVYLHFKPHGGGKQNTLMVDGAPYELENNFAYDVFSASMDVYLYNDSVDGNGKAKGRWKISLVTTCASFLVSP